MRQKILYWLLVGIFISRAFIPVKRDEVRIDLVGMTHQGMPILRMELNDTVIYNRTRVVRESDRDSILNLYVQHLTPKNHEIRYK